MHLHRQLRQKDWPERTQQERKGSLNGSLSEEPVVPVRFGPSAEWPDEVWPCEAGAAAGST